MTTDSAQPTAQDPCSLCGSTRSVRYVRYGKVYCESLRGCTDRRYGPPPKYTHTGAGAERANSDHAAIKVRNALYPCCRSCGGALEEVPV